MNETTPPIGVSLHFLQRILEDKRLRRPVHKLGRPTAKIETMKVPPLQSLAKSLRLHSDLPVNEFDLYNDLTIKREALIKHLKRVPSTTTHIFECLIKRNLQALYEQNSEMRNRGSFAELVLKDNPRDVGIATDYVIHAHNVQFRYIVDALEAHEEHLDESWEHLEPPPCRYYFIDIFCETPSDVHHANESNANTLLYYETQLVETMHRIGSALLVLGPMLSVTPQDDTVQLTQQQYLSTSNTKVLWEMYVASIHVSSFHCLLASKNIDVFETCMLSNEFVSLLEKFQHQVMIPAARCITSGGTVLQNQYTDNALHHLMNKQWDGGVNTVESVVTETFNRWYGERAWDVCVKWQLVEEEWLIGNDTNSAENDGSILRGDGTTTAPTRKRRRSSGKRRSSLSRSSSRSGSRPGSRNGRSRSNSKHGSRPSSGVQRPHTTKPAGSRTSSKGKQHHEHIEEDPIYEVLCIVVQHLLAVHILEQTQKNLGNIETEFNRPIDRYGNSRHLKRSLRLICEVIDERISTFGPNHPFTFDAYILKAKILQQQGLLFESFHLISSKVLGWLDEPEKIQKEEEWNVSQQKVVVVDKQEDQENQKDQKEDLNGNEKQVDVIPPKSREELCDELPLTDPRTLNIFSLMGSVLVDLEKFQDAELFLSRAAKGLGAIKGETSNEVFNAFDQLAECYQKSQDFQKAKDLRKRTRNKRMAIGGIRQENTTNNDNTNKDDNNIDIIHDERILKASQELGDLLSLTQTEDNINQSEAKEAVSLFRIASTGRTAMLGKNHRLVLASLHALATALGHCLQLDEAIEVIRQVVARRNSTLGPDHLDTLRSIELEARLRLKRLERKGDGEMEIEVIDVMEQLLKEIVVENEMDENERQAKQMKEEMNALLATTASNNVNEQIQTEEQKALLLLLPLPTMNEEATIEQLLRRASLGYTQTIGMEHPHNLSITNVLGNYLHSISDAQEGKYDQESETILRDVLIGRKKELGLSHKDTLQTMNDLADNLVRRNKWNNLVTIKIKGKENRMGIIQECEQLYRAVLKGREILLGIEHPDTMLTVNQLASLLYECGDTSKEKEAEILFKRDLTWCEFNFDDNHVSTIKSLVNLAHVFWNRRKKQQRKQEEVGNLGDETELVLQKKEKRIQLEKALLLMQRAKNAKVVVYGEQHASTIRTIQQLAAILHELGQYDECILQLRVVLSYREIHLNECNALTLGTMSLLSDVLKDRKQEGDTIEAEELIRQELQGYERTIGTTKHKILTVVCKLAKFLFSTNPESKQIEILQLMNRTVNGYQIEVGENNIQTLDARLYLAKMYLKYKLFENALSQARLCVNGHVTNRDVRRIFGTIKILEECLRELNQHEEADSVLYHALKKSVGTLDRRTLEAMRNLAVQPWQSNYKHDNLGSIELWKIIVENQTKLLGESNPTTLRSIKMLISCLINRRKSPNTDCVLLAFEWSKKEVAVMVKYFGAKHLETLNAVQRLGELIWYKLKKPEAALSCIKRNYEGKKLVFGDFDVRTLSAASNLINLYNVLEVSEHDVEEIARKSLEGWEKLMEHGEIDVMQGKTEISKCAEQLVQILRKLGDTEEMERVICWYNCERRK